MSDAPLPNGITFEPLCEEGYRRVRKDFQYFESGIVRLRPGGCFMPKIFLSGLNYLHQFQSKRDDVWIVTYPKCGTTWTQEIVWTMRNNPDLDHPQAKLGINFRCPFVEADFLDDFEMWAPFLKDDSQLVKEFYELCPEGDIKKPLFSQVAESIPHSRTLKSHLPLSILSPKLLDESKIIYVARNPKDTCISYYHHSRLLSDIKYSGSLEQFVHYFIDGEVLYGGYDKHIEDLWKFRTHKNLHLIHYEDLKENPKREFKRLDTFLGTNLSDQQLDKIVDYTSFSEMRKRDAVVTDNSEMFYVKEVKEQEGGFFRKGEVGNFKCKLSPEMEELLDQWIERTIDPIGINFRYNL